MLSSFHSEIIDGILWLGNINGHEYLEMTLMKRLGIGVTGMPGAGKSLFSAAAEKLGLPVVRMGDIVFDEVKKRGLPLTLENVGKIAIELRREYGPDIVARKVIERIQSGSFENQQIIVIEGIRSLEEVNVFKNFFEEFILVAIHAPPNIRYERLIKRGRADDTLNVDKLKKRDLRELGMGIGNVIAMADEVLINKDKTYEAFFNECIDFLHALIKKLRD